MILFPLPSTQMIFNIPFVSNFTPIYIIPQTPLSNQDLKAMLLHLQQTMMWMSQIMQQRGLTPSMTTNQMPVTTSSHAPTPMFVLEAKNLEPITATQGTQRRRDNEAFKEPPTKLRSCVVRSLIEEDVDAGKSTTLGRYKSKSKGEETNSMSPTRLKKLEIEEKGVDEKTGKTKRTLG